MDKVAAAASKPSDVQTASSSDVQKPVSDKKTVPAVEVDAVTKAIEKLDINKPEIAKTVPLSAQKADNTILPTVAKSSLPTTIVPAPFAVNETTLPTIAVTNGVIATDSSNVTPTKSEVAKSRKSPIGSPALAKPVTQNGDLDASLTGSDEPDLGE